MSKRQQAMEGSKWDYYCITVDLEFNKKLYNWFSKEKFGDLKKKYRIVGIMGAQGTGKSTFCNKVFGSDFQVQIKYFNEEYLINLI